MAATTTRPSPSRVDYTLSAQLDAQQHRIFSRGEISITNNSSKELTELWFHLYMNAFAHPGTRFLRPSTTGQGVSRSQNQLREPGSIRVLSLERRDELGRDLWPTADEHSPEDPEDETDIRVPLQRPIEPGETLTLLVEFETDLPEIVERTGYERDFHLVSGWYPKLARLDPNGEFRHFSFHPNGEFSANFGDYRVELDVPEAFRVGHSGRSLEERSAHGRRHLVAELHDALDFAWTAWPGFDVQRSRVGEVEVTWLFPQGLDWVPDITRRTVASALAVFGKRFGSYAYPTLTVVHPPDFADAAGGMEYPSLITTGGSPWLARLGTRWTETVTAHELAHQWFYALLASDEYREPFLDESLTTFAEASYLEDQWPSAGAFSSRWLSISAWSVISLQASSAPAHRSALLPAPAFTSFGELGSVIYGRAPLALETIRRSVGRERFDAMLGIYARKFRFGHPEFGDFLAVLKSELGAKTASDLKHLLEGVQAGYRIEQVASFRSAHGYASFVQVAAEGGVHLPSSLRLEFADGSSSVLPIWGPNDHHVEHESPLVRAVVDPKRDLLIDRSFSNNSWRAEPSATPTLSLFLARFLAEIALWGLL